MTVLERNEDQVRIGIDAAVVADHQIAIRGPGIREDFRASPTLAGMAKLTERLMPYAGSLVVVEPTAGTWLPLTMAVRRCDSRSPLPTPCTMANTPGDPPIRNIPNPDNLPDALNSLTRGVYDHTRSQSQGSGPIIPPIGSASDTASPVPPRARLCRAPTKPAGVAEPTPFAPKPLWRTRRRTNVPGARVHPRATSGPTCAVRSAAL